MGPPVLGAHQCIEARQELWEVRRRILGQSSAAVLQWNAGETYLGLNDQDFKTENFVVPIFGKMLQKIGQHFLLSCIPECEVAKDQEMF